MYVKAEDQSQNKGADWKDEYSLMFIVCNPHRKCVCKKMRCHEMFIFNKIHIKKKNQ